MDGDGGNGFLKRQRYLKMSKEIILKLALKQRELRETYYFQNQI